MTRQSRFGGMVSIGLGALTLMIVLPAVTACSRPSAADDPDAWQARLATADPARAERLYTRTRDLPGETEPVSCAVCHGAQGGGNYGLEDPRHVAPRLAGLNEAYVGEQLRLYATGRRDFALMHAMAAPLSAQDVADLARYVRGMRGPRLAPATGASYAQLSEGRSIWAEGGPAGPQACASCHGADGAGAVMRSPEIAGEPVAYLKRQLRVLRDRGRTGTAAGDVMTAVARRLTDRQIDAVSTYVGSIDPVSARSAATRSPGAKP